jgi:hypothetical protein
MANGNRHLPISGSPMIKSKVPLFLSIYFDI